MALTSILKNRHMVTCSPYDTINSVAQLMRDNDVGAIVVLEDEQPVGIITDRDIVVRCLADNLDPGEMKADDVMSTPVETIPSHCGVYELIEQMAEKNVRRLIMMGEDGQPEGVISLGDMLELLSVELAKLVTATGQGRKESVSDRVA